MQGLALLQEGVRLTEMRSDRASNMDRAIQLICEAATILLRHQAYAEHALAQYELGLAFHNRVNGEPRSNLRWLRKI